MGPSLDLFVNTCENIDDSSAKTFIIDFTQNVPVIDFLIYLS